MINKYINDWNNQSQKLINQWINQSINQSTDQMNESVIEGLTSLTTVRRPGSCDRWKTLHEGDTSFSVLYTYHTSTISILFMISFLVITFGSLSKKVLTAEPVTGKSLKFPALSDIAPSACSIWDMMWPCWNWRVQQLLAGKSTRSVCRHMGHVLVQERHVMWQVRSLFLICCPMLSALMWSEMCFNYRLSCDIIIFQNRKNTNPFEVFHRM